MRRTSLFFSTLVALGTGGAVGACQTDAFTNADASTDAMVDQGSADAGCIGACDGDGGCDGGDCKGNDVVTTAMGTGFGCAALKNGNVWCWGNNFYGQVASPPGSAHAAPGKIAGLSNVTGLSAGANHVCAIESDATIWCWGINDYGELGHTPGTSGDVLGYLNAPCNATPTKVPQVLAKQVSSGRWTTCAVTTTSGLVCWGFNGAGQLGQGDGPSDGTATPTPISGLSNLVTVRVSAFKGDNVCAIDTQHALRCWGSNNWGQLGDGSLSGDATTCYEPGGPATSTCRTSPAIVPGMTNVIDVATSLSTCVARTDGTVWCWGDSRGGEMGNGPTNGNPQLVPTQVAGFSDAANIDGSDTLCATTSGGSVSCWGVGKWALPNGYGVDAGCLDQAGTPTTCQLTPAPIPGLTTIGFPRVGMRSAIALTASGPVAWGANDTLQLGHAPDAGDDDSGNDPSPSPVIGVP